MGKMNLLMGKEKLMIGMVHLRALPGTPRHSLKMADIVRTAVEEAGALRAAGFDAVLIENMHDVPYLKRSVGPEITAAVTAAAAAVIRAVDCPVGIQILAGANREALAAALAAGAAFIRAEGLVFAHVADEGIIEADAGELLRYRKAIEAGGILVLADIKKKHSSHAITADVDLAETAHAAEFFGADGLIVTGTATGAPTRKDDLIEARKGTSLPLLVGSGTTPENLDDLWTAADGFIIGSWLKEGGRWDRPLDPGRVKEIIASARRLKSGPGRGR